MYRKSAPGIAMKNFNAFATRLTPSMMLSQVVRLLLSRLLQKLTPHPGVEPGDGNRQLDPSGGAYFVGAIHRDGLICLAHPERAGDPLSTGQALDLHAVNGDYRSQPLSIS